MSVRVDDYIGIPIFVVVVLLLPHITKRYTGMFASIIKRCIHEKVSNSKCVDIKFCIVLKFIPYIYIQGMMLLL